MNSFPPAVRRFGHTAMEARAHRTRQVMSRTVAKRVRVRLWLPTTPLFLLLSPFALLLAPLGYLAPQRFCPRPYAAVLAFGAVLLSLAGTEVLVQARDADIHIRLF